VRPSPAVRSSSARSPSAFSASPATRWSRCPPPEARSEAITPPCRRPRPCAAPTSKDRSDGDVSVRSTALAAGDAAPPGRRAGAPPGSFAGATLLEGRVTNGPLVKGEPILAAKLAPPGTRQGMAAVIPENLRAMTVPVNEVVGVAGFIHPGDFVDVVTTMQTP